MEPTLHIPLGDIQRMSEYFRRVAIRFFLKKELINSHLATSLINWKHSGFCVDHSIRIPAFSIRARVALSQYIARPPLSLKKISIEENGVGTVISFSSDNEFFKGKTETFAVMQFFLELTQHIPPKAASIFGGTACMGGLIARQLPNLRRSLPGSDYKNYYHFDKCCRRSDDRASKVSRGVPLVGTVGVLPCPHNGEAVGGSRRRYIRPS